MALGFLIRYLIVHQASSFPTATANRLAFHVPPQGSYYCYHSIIIEAHRNKEERCPPPTRTLICLMISHTLTQEVRLSFSCFQVRLLYITLRSTLYLLMMVLALSTIPLSTAWVNSQTILASPAGHPTCLRVTYLIHWGEEERLCTVQNPRVD